MVVLLVEKGPPTTAGASIDGTSKFALRTDRKFPRSAQVGGKIVGDVRCRVRQGYSHELNSSNAVDRGTR